MATPAPAFTLSVLVARSSSFGIVVGVTSEGSEATLYVVVNVMGARFADRLSRVLEGDIARSVEVTRAAWRQRPLWMRYVVEPVCYALRRYL